MATAIMTYVGERQGKSAFEVRTEVPGKRFPVSPGRSWCNFRLLGEHDAIWEWRLRQGWQTNYQSGFEEFALWDAARALPLPPWATARRFPAGGPGTGYDAAFILLDPGYALKNLNDWLNPGGENGSLDL